MKNIPSMYAKLSSQRWENHPLGSLNDWPRCLSSTIDCVFSNEHPAFLLWGDQLWEFYNDAFQDTFCPNRDNPCYLGTGGKDSENYSWIDLPAAAAKVFSGKSHCIPKVAALWPEPYHKNYIFNLTPVFDGGDVAGILACGHPIHTAFHGEAEISSFFDSHLAVAVLHGPDLSVRFASEKIQQYFNVSQADLQGTLTSILPHIQTTGLITQVKQISITKKPLKIEHQLVCFFRHGKREKRFVDFCLEPCLDSLGNAVDILVTAADVTYKIYAERKIRRRELQIFESSQRLDIALQAGNLGSYELILDTGKIKCTDQCKANFGLLPSDAMDYHRLLESILPLDRPAMQQAVAGAIADHHDYQATYRVLWADQSLHWISASGRALYADDGTPLKMVGVTKDITSQMTEQQRLEELIAIRTQELREANQMLERVGKRTAESLSQARKSNASLEGFAYTASHDLQEPLRKIQSFGQLIKKRLIIHQDAGGVELVERMQKASERMSALIHDLLDLSRLSTKNHLQPVLLQDAVDRALEALELKILESNAVIQIDPLYTVYGDIFQLSQLFQNLISNALRFASADRTPIIKISYDSVVGSQLSQEHMPEMVADFYHKIVVSDNGVGFEQQYAKQIFEVFKRLHGRSSYEGTGIGLAICRQVVENHNGIIYAQGEPGYGAAFTILLPMEGKQ